MAAAADPVLLLHGQPGSAQDWDRVRFALRGRLETIAIDRPGWDRASSARNLDGNARHALAALDRAGADRATVVGYSWGGAVAAWIAATRAERVSRLVLLAPAANVRSLVPIDYALAAPLLGELSSAAALAAVGVAFGRLYTLRDWRSFVAEQRVLVRELPQLERMLARITAPTTIVIGTADRLVPLRSARELAAQIGGAELVEIAGGNHLVPWRHAERVAQILLRSSTAEAGRPTA